MNHNRSHILDWIDRNFGKVATSVIVLAILLGVAGSAIADTAEPSYDPEGEVFQTDARAQEVFGSTLELRSVTFIVDRPDGGNALTRGTLLEVIENTAQARRFGADHLTTVFDHDLGVEIDGIVSIADAVDDVLPNGIASATESEVEQAVRHVIDGDSPWSGLRFTLPQTVGADNPDGAWQSPVFQVAARYDITTFDGEDDDDRERNAETWLRTFQTELRGDEIDAGLIGVGIDPILTGEEQTAAGGPYIFVAVGFIVLLVAALMRSYWSAVVVATGLSVTLLVYNGVLGLLGVNMASALIVFVIPMTLIAFGVDFFVHAAERTRAGGHEQGSYPVAMRAALPALALATATSIAAFAANTISDIQAIVQFGIAASIGLLVAFAVLGVLGPRALSAVERRIGAPRRRLTRYGRWIAIIPVSILAGSMVSVSALLPTAGAVALPIFVGLFVLAPLAVIGRRREEREEIVRDESGAEHESRSVASVATFFARWRKVTLPVFLGIGPLGLGGAMQVTSAFEVSDFFSADTEFVEGIDRLEEHFGEATGGSAYIYVEGDLTDPQTLDAMERAVDYVDNSAAQLARDLDGELVVIPNAAELVRSTMAAEGAADRVASLTGTPVVDTDDDGLPDSPEAVEAIYRTALASGIENGEGKAIFTAEQVKPILWAEGDVQATRLEVLVTSFTDDDIILDARETLDEAAAVLRRDLGEAVTTVAVSGEVIASQDSLAAFTDAMLVSLPLAIVLTVAIVATTLRSIRFSVVTIVPILLVVFCVWGYMWLRGLTVNPVTATIAAIAVGVGIDYCTHFTMRFREELQDAASPLAAVGRAAAGTGTALAVSALTSIVGFGVMATAPAPIFASFGELMAVMIVLSLVVALVVLPSLLVIVAPTGDRPVPAYLSSGDAGTRIAGTGLSPQVSMIEGSDGRAVRPPSTVIT